MAQLRKPQILPFFHVFSSEILISAKEIAGKKEIRFH
jgi:hypothetical protein